MVFSSILFLFYFLPLFLLIYALAPMRARNAVALGGSLLFYAWGAPIFVFALIASALGDHILGLQMAKASPGKDRQKWLAIGLVLNAGLLLYFKYANFFVENLSTALASLGTTPPAWTAVALPIGISFFTFQKISYLVDVYRGTSKPLKHFHNYLLFVAFFPQLIAGPIVRFREIADQIVDRAASSHVDNRINGFFRFGIGLAKKVLIADVLAVQADLYFTADPALLSTGQAWIGIIAYTFQIYFDFSGYSDMAIGLGRIMGFTFPENFNFPYIARNITEFWRRWHITLSNWMRDYLYIPLGGNRVSKARLFVNLWLVFLISGFWHGASWNFVIWGAFHGFFLIADRLFMLKVTQTIGRVPSMLLTFLIVLIAWVFFRAENLSLALGYLGSMAGAGLGSFVADAPTSRFWFILILAICFAFMGIIPKIETWQETYERSINKPVQLLLKGLTIVLLLALCAGEIAATDFSPFIYFRF